jgi:hypothetical protein
MTTPRGRLRKGPVLGSKESSRLAVIVAQLRAWQSARAARGPALRSLHALRGLEESMLIVRRPSQRKATSAGRSATAPTLQALRAHLEAVKLWKPEHPLCQEIQSLLEEG